MEITVEFLEKVPNKPEWLGEWHNEITPNGDLFWYCKRPGKSRFSVYINEEGAVFVAEPNLQSGDNLRLALYARHVAIEIERRMNPVRFLEPTKQEILQGMVATHDRIEIELSRLAKTKPMLEGDFTKGEFPADDVDTILARVNYSVKWLHWSRSGASWRDIWRDRARYKLLGPWRLENPAKDAI